MWALLPFQHCETWTDTGNTGPHSNCAYTPNRTYITPNSSSLMRKAAPGKSLSSTPFLQEPSWRLNLAALPWEPLMCQECSSIPETITEGMWGCLSEHKSLGAEATFNNLSQENINRLVLKSFSPSFSLAQLLFWLLLEGRGNEHLKRLPSFSLWGLYSSSLLQGALSSHHHISALLTLSCPK